MKPIFTGQKYDRIAQWWQTQHADSSYGVKQVLRAINFVKCTKKALDVGCGAGGRLIAVLENKGFSVTGLDVSEQMIALAEVNHPEQTFLHQDIAVWESEETFDFILAWDSLFHLPLHMHKPVITKLCQHLADNGVIIYTFGNAVRDHTDQWRNNTFYYSSIGINKNIETLLHNGMTILHLELDQFPEKHTYVIAAKF
ncbi:MAG: class I SAM-dependent methyltransferase [Acidiferrobacterales bacterium]|nr:class I SAM-dependent methyltransferase [Acidiferrobacterales bacterium]